MMPNCIYVMNETAEPKFEFTDKARKLCFSLKHIYLTIVLNNCYHFNYVVLYITNT